MLTPTLLYVITRLRVGEVYQTLFFKSKSSFCDFCSTLFQMARSIDVNF